MLEAPPKSSPEWEDFTHGKLVINKDYKTIVNKIEQ